MKLVILLLSILPCLAFASAPLRPVRTDAPPELDGFLSDPVWQKALVVSNFLQRLPREGASPTEKTEFRFLYTEHSLFIAFRGFDSHPKDIVATIMRRDDFDIVENDQIAIAIDSY